MSNFIKLEKLDNFSPFEGMKAKLVHTATQTFAFWEIEDGTILPTHQHYHEQVSYITKGELQLTIKDKTQILCEGMFVVIPPNTDHSAKALTKVSLTDVFSPVREDFPQ
ncbi:MAG: cupin domain-containing protein [Saprospiraceae bacterium]